MDVHFRTPGISFTEQRIVVHLLPFPGITSTNSKVIPFSHSRMILLASTPFLVGEERASANSFICEYSDF